MFSTLWFALRQKIEKEVSGYMWHKHRLASPYFWLLISCLLSQHISQLVRVGGKMKDFSQRKSVLVCIWQTLRSGTNRKLKCHEIKFGYCVWGGKLKIVVDVRLGPEETKTRALLSQCDYDDVTHWSDCIVRLSFISKSWFVMTALPLMLLWCVG